MDPGEPECLVRVDVPDSSGCLLIEERPLHRRAPPGQRACECGVGERAFERLAADTGSEVLLQLAGLEQRPGTEPADVPVGDVRAVV